MDKGKMITEQLRNPNELDINLRMEFGPFETVHKWKRMSECYEFVGARYIFSIFVSISSFSMSTFHNYYKYLRFPLHPYFFFMCQIRSLSSSPDQNFIKSDLIIVINLQTFIQITYCVV